MITPILETQKLRLRPAKVSDAEAVYNNWASDPSVTKYMRWNTHGSIDETIEWLTRAESVVSDKNSYDWLFVLKETNEPIGSGGVFVNTKHDAHELGYCIMQSRWGQGFAVEASKEILRFAADELGATEFFATHAKDNPASGKVLEKLGFVYKSDGEYSSFDGKREFKSCEYFLML